MICRRSFQLHRVRNLQQSVNQSMSNDLVPSILIEEAVELTLLALPPGPKRAE